MDNPPEGSRSTLVRVWKTTHPGIDELKRAFRARTTTSTTTPEIVDAMLSSRTLAEWVEIVIRYRMKQLEQVSTPEQETP